ncbi:MAG: nucleotide exchange factor GrpE [Sedimentisphaerales bacterium]|nr:nucleotide exchange factor GrpE [Sedimentisphaerales bacterium]
MKKKDKEKPIPEDFSESESVEQEKLRETIEDLLREKEELFEKLQRVSADYANFQKRVPKQIADSVAYEKEMIIKSLLPALDNFEHTLQNSDSAEDVSVLAKGIRIIYDQMLDILKSHGVEQMETLGENFDPALHEAMMQRSDPEKENNVVLQEFQKGYRLNGRVIRPGKVIVNKLEVSQTTPAQDEKDSLPQTDEEQANSEFETKDTE